MRRSIDATKDKLLDALDPFSLSCIFLEIHIGMYMLVPVSNVAQPFLQSAKCLSYLL